MQRIQHPTAAAALPERTSSGTTGYFQEGDVSGSPPATYVTADWLNNVTEEIVSVIDAASITLSGTDNTQLLDAINALIQNAMNAANFVPVGTVTFRATNSAPTGWLYCDGSAVSRSTYATLFAAIGTTFGAGNGSTTFNLPDLRGQFVRGWNNSASGDDASRTFGTKQTELIKNHVHANTLAAAGAHTHTITMTAVANHTHANTLAAASAGTPAGTIVSAGGHTHTASTQDGGGKHTHLIKVAKNDGSGGNGTGFRMVGPTESFYEGITVPGGDGAHNHVIDVSTVSNHTHAFSGSAMATHNHTITNAAAGGHTPTVASISDPGNHSHTITNVNNTSGGAETRPTNVALHPMIKY